MRLIIALAAGFCVYVLAGVLIEPIIPIKAPVALIAGVVVAVVVYRESSSY